MHAMNRALVPAVPVLALAVISWAGYFGAWQVTAPTMHQAMAAVFGTTYFLAIAFGTTYVYTAAMLRGARLGSRILASAVTPFCWMTKEVWLQTAAHPLGEALYWYINPLNFWLVCFMGLQMGLGTLLARAILRRRGSAVPVFTPAPVATVVVSMGLVIGAYAWGRGENLYVLFLEGYRLIYGTGV